MRVMKLGIYLMGIAIFALPMHAGEGLRKEQSKIKGLLIVTLPNDDFAGTASQMNCTATEADRDSEVKVTMNQKVGESMGKALNEVQKYLKLRHSDWPRGYDIEIAFGDKYVPKDGPSAAVASALLIDSLITGSEIRSTFAVTGDMNADGSVLPIGGVSAKIRGAIRKRCDVVAVPHANIKSVSDMVLLEGRSNLYKTQLFSIDTFDDAFNVSRAVPDAEMAEAMMEFGLVADVLSSKGEKYLGNNKVQDKLEHVIALAPNHLSAKLLLEIGQGQGPGQLSLEGSIQAIRNSTGVVMSVVERGRIKNLSDSLRADKLGDAITEARDLQKIIDKRTEGYLKAVMRLAENLRDYQQNPPRSNTVHNRKVSTINASLDGVNGEYERLMSNSSIMEELMLEE